MRISLLGLLLVAACGSAGDVDDFDDEAADGSEKADSKASLKTCAKSHAGKTADGNAVTICDELYAERPFLRPPADSTKAGKATMYVAVHLSGGATAFDRDGKAYMITNRPAALRLQSNRNMYLVYKIVGTVGEKPFNGGAPVPSIDISSAKPAVLVGGEALANAYLGEWEGTVAKRIDPAKFSWTESLPLHVRFDRLEAQPNFKVWGDARNVLEDGTNFALAGEISNLSSRVQGSDGKCLPALAEANKGNPFAGATDSAMQIYRLAAMHYPGDQVEVIDWPAAPGLSVLGMTGLNLFDLADTLLSDEKNSVRFLPHGTPNGFSLTLKRVAAGGESCR